MAKAEPHSAKWKGWYLFFCGICMGAADLVPGISGGTIAFIMGFYNRLLESIKTLNTSALKKLLRGEFSSFLQQVEWKFIFILIAGITFSFFTLSSFFHFVLEHEVYRIYLYSVFLGLILASFIFCIRQLKQWKARHLISLVFGMVTAYLLTGEFLNSTSEGTYSIRIHFSEKWPSLTNYNTSNQLLTNLSDTTLGTMWTKGLVKSDTVLFDLEGKEIGKVEDFVIPYQDHKIDAWLIFCGAIAICALLLPGISGSYLLNLMGVYPIVIGALADLVEGIKVLRFDHEAFYILMSLGIGIIVGALFFSRFASWLLRSYPDVAMAILSGFMIGALRSVWPFWSYEYALLPLKIHKGPQLLLTDPIWPSLFSLTFLYSALCAIGGFVVVFLIEYLAKWKESQLLNSQSDEEKVREQEPSSQLFSDPPTAG